MCIIFGVGTHSEKNGNFSSAKIANIVNIINHRHFIDQQINKLIKKSDK